jgi:hypothetical protein
MSIVAYNYLDQHDIDIDYHHNQLDDQHNHDRGTDYDHHYLDQHIIDHDDNHNRAALHWLMHVAMARRITEMDQSLWR